MQSTPAENLENTQRPAELHCGAVAGPGIGEQLGRVAGTNRGPAGG